jgi:hypothetical protein
MVVRFGWERCDFLRREGETDRERPLCRERVEGRVIITGAITQTMPRAIEGS